MSLLLPEGFQQFFNLSGQIASSGSVETYQPNTLIPKATYQDAAGTISNSNPVDLDGYGRCVMYGNGPYRLIIKDVDGNTIADVYAFGGISQAMEPVVGANTLVEAAQALGISPFMQTVLLSEDSATATAALGAVNKAGDTMSGGLAITSNPDHSITIAGYGSPTYYTSLSVEGTTAFATQNEALAVANFTSSTGSALPGYNKVALYAAIAAQVGSGRPFGMIASAWCDVGAITTLGMTAAYGALSNNSGTSFGDTITATAAPTVDGFSANGYGTNRATGALRISGTLTDNVSPVWNRGVYAVAGSIRLAFLQDASSADVSYDLRGTHTYGIDTSAATFVGGAIRLNYNQSIQMLNAGGSVNIQMLRSNSASDMILGSADVASAYVDCQTAFQPIVDNFNSLGSAAHRWTAVWAVNGTIQTSDPALKTGVAPLVDVGAIIDAIEPISYRFVVGGQETYEEPVKTQVQATEDVEEVYFEHELRGDKMVEVRKTRIVKQRVFDFIPLYDESGMAIYEHRPAEPALVDSQGKIVRPAVPEQNWHKHLQVPRMVDTVQMVTKYRDKPGKRVHFGFDASQLAQIGELSGLGDYGGFVRGEDGTLGRRPDQENAILWAEVRSLRARLAKLEGKKK